MVQNEYLELLLETGILGFGIFAVLVVGLFYATRHHKYIWPIFIALLAQWWFFSGYPNTLHIFIICITGYAFIAHAKTTRR